MDDNIKMYLMGDMDLILLALDGEPWRALVNTVMNPKPFNKDPVPKRYQLNDNCFK